MKYTLKMVWNKKGDLWLSWVLLFAFAIALSAASYQFIIPHVNQGTETMKRVVFDTDECRQVALSIEEACHDSLSQDLNMTIRNRNYVTVDELRFQWFGANNMPIDNEFIESKIGVDRTKKYSLNSTTSDSVTFVKVTPVIYRENMVIVCSEKDASLIVETC